MAPKSVTPKLTAGALELEYVKCDLCGADDTRERYRKPDARRWTSDFEFPVVECTRCGLVYVNPRPTPAGMAPFYAGGYHDGRDSEGHKRRYERQVAFLPPLTDETVLDIGCARGDFLAFLLGMSPGIRAHGVDAFSSDVSDPRIEFRPRALPDCGFADATFDLVTSWAVFEHLHDPSRYFAEVARILEPGGRFVFLVTNAESHWSRRAFREDVPRHTYHYSPATLRGYAKKAGFEVRRIVCDDGIFDGRGKGTFRWKFQRAAGVDFAIEAARSWSFPQRAARAAGRFVDGVVFGTHWEAWLGRSGIVVAEFARPRA